MYMMHGPTRNAQERSARPHPAWRMTHTNLTTCVAAVLNAANLKIYTAALGTELGRGLVASAGCAAYWRRVEQVRVDDLGSGRCGRPVLEVE